MNKKRILSVVMIFVMVIAMAAAGCGKKEEAATDKEKPKTEAAVEDQTESKEEATDEAVEPEEEGTDESEAGEADKGLMKTGEDSLTEEDIQNLKDSIRDVVISEYLEPNKISVEEFVWPDVKDECWEYLIKLIESFNIAVETDVEISVEEPSTQYQKLMKAVFNGIISWLDGQGSYDTGYVLNVEAVLKPYNALIPAIDIKAE